MFWLVLICPCTKSESIKKIGGAAGTTGTTTGTTTANHHLKWSDNISANITKPHLFSLTYISFLLIFLMLVCLLIALTTPDSWIQSHCIHSYDLNSVCFSLKLIYHQTLTSLTVFIAMI